MRGNVAMLHLKQMEEHSFTVGSLAETSYRNEPEILEEWQEFYLPDHMYMQVIGVCKEFSCDSLDDELVLMLCEDGKVFANEGNRLHLTKNNLKELFEHGLQFPGTKEYYRVQSFEDMTTTLYGSTDAAAVVHKQIFPDLFHNCHKSGGQYPLIPTIPHVHL
ncbi:hypothetical protein HF521_011781 [Silurus meridionalis]|uniref:Uncharacterized protein n=1 Tax=Silurus meridionalis TaxID=175797 RepID=A0A8T0ACK8_SILME|nr:hypothetical protein HF521_011781 [Silurus meridionalis]